MRDSFGKRTGVIKHVMELGAHLCQIHMQIAFTSLSFISRRRGLHSYSNALKVDRQ